MTWEPVPQSLITGRLSDFNVFSLQVDRTKEVFGGNGSVGERQEASPP